MFIIHCEAHLEIRDEEDIEYWSYGRILGANRIYKYYEIMQIQDQMEMSKINE